MFLLLVGNANGAGLFTFNSEDEFTENFVEAGSSTNRYFSFAPLSGVGGQPGRVAVRVGWADTLYFAEPLMLSESNVWRISTFYSYRHYAYDPVRENNPDFLLGLANSTNHLSMCPVAASEYIAVALVVGTGGDTRKLAVISRGGGGSIPTYSTDFALSSGLYQLVGTWVRAGTNAFNSSVGLYSYGADGTGPVTQIAVYSGISVNSALATGSALFAGMQGVATPWLDNVAVEELPPPPTPVITSWGTASPGVLRVVVQTVPGWIYSLESSEDFTTWETRQITTAFSNSVEFVESTSAVPFRFFRARVP
jgi:hypothetical protein